MKQMKSSRPVFAITRENLKRFWPVSMFPLLLMILSSTVFVLISQEGRKEQVKLLLAFAKNANPGFVIALICLSVAAGLTTFKYMQTSSESSWMHALPVTRKELFAASYLSGLILIAVPIIITGLVNLIFTMRAAYIEWMAVSFVLCLFMYSVSVLAASISGNVLMHLSDTVILIHLVPGIILTALAYAAVFLYGFSGEYLYGWLEKSYVFTALIYKYRASTVIIYLIISVLISAAALLLYEKRAVENTDDSLVFRPLNAVFMVSSCFIGASCFGLMFAELLDTNWMVSFMCFGLFGVILAYIPTHLLVYRNFSIFSKKKLIYLGISMCLAVVFAVTVNLFGAAYALKSPKDAANAGVDIFRLEYEDYYNGQYFKGTEDGYLVLKDKDSIEAVRDLQKKMVKEFRKNTAKDSSLKDDSEYPVSIFYTGKNGKKISRAYDPIDSRQIKKVRPELMRIYESKEFKKTFRMSNLKYRVLRVEISKNDENIAILKSGDKTKALLKAVDRDLENRPFSEFINNEQKESGYSLQVFLDRNGDIEETSLYLTVPASFKNTAKWLSANGY